MIAFLLFSFYPFVRRGCWILLSETLPGTQSLIFKNLSSSSPSSKLYKHAHIINIFNWVTWWTVDFLKQRLCFGGRGLSISLHDLPMLVCWKAHWNRLLCYSNRLRRLFDYCHFLFITMTWLFHSFCCQESINTLLLPNAS